MNDPFWDVQTEITKVLGNIRTNNVLQQLLKAVKLQNTKARTAVATALGQFYKNDKAFDALVKMLRDEDSYFVPAAPATSIGKLQHKCSFVVLKEQLEKAPSSWHSIILQGVLNGLVETEKEEAIEHLKRYLPAEADDYLRRIVPRALARLGIRYKKEHPEIANVLSNLLEDKSYRVQFVALRGAKEYGEPKLIPLLQKIADTAVESSIVRYAREVIRTLRRKKGKTEIVSIKKRIEKIE